jgi:glycosyltransferase involved in cell wall biosynthesis
MSPRVAVVVPCYNSGATLPETLASVQHEPCELVVVDDGSTDPATLVVLQTAEADGVRIVRQENAGVAVARMTGVAATEAPYVFPLDADDLLARGALDELADALDANPAAALAWGYIGAVGSDSFTRQAPRLDPWLITYMNQVPVMSLIRRDRLLEAGGWKPGREYEDWDLWMSFAERGWDGIRIPRIIAYYRMSHSGRWASSRGRYDDAVRRMAADHAALFAARPANRRRSRAPLRLKLVLPLLDRLPMSQRNKRRLGELLRSPRLVLRYGVLRRR